MRQSIGPASTELTSTKEGLLIAWERKISHFELKQMHKLSSICRRILKLILISGLLLQSLMLSLFLKGTGLRQSYMSNVSANKVAHGLADIGRSMELPRLTTINLLKVVLQTMRRKPLHQILDPFLKIFSMECVLNVLLYLLHLFAVV